MSFIVKTFGSQIIIEFMLEGEKASLVLNRDESKSLATQIMECLEGKNSYIS
jgi:hypothetical protein